MNFNLFDQNMKYQHFLLLFLFCHLLILFIKVLEMLFKQISLNFERLILISYPFWLPIRINCLYSQIMKYINWIHLSYYYSLSMYSFHLSYFLVNFMFLKGCSYKILFQIIISCKHCFLMNKIYYFVILYSIIHLSYYHLLSCNSLNSIHLNSFDRQILNYFMEHFHLFPSYLTYW